MSARCLRLRQSTAYAHKKLSGKKREKLSRVRRKILLRDRKGIEFPVRCTNGFSELFNSRPIYMADRMSEVKNADFVLLEFTTEDKEQISSVLKAYQNGSSPEIEFTRGLLYRGVE